MFKKRKKIITLVIIFTMIFGCCALATKVLAFTQHGEGNHCFSLNIDENGFPVSSVTINGETWDKTDEHRYYSNDNIYTIVIKAGKKGNQYPWISTAGGLDDYKTYTAIENPTDDPNVIGDEYLLTLKLNNIPYEGACSNFGISLQDGPFPVLPEIAASADINITISGDELEYHYVEDKPNEADVTYFKFGINSGISDDIVPFTFGNANYVHNSNPAPNNVSSVSTKQAIHYEYIYNGTGFVTFYVNGGGTDEYTKIEINGVDYSDQAPHSQIEVFEHLNGWASVFEIQNVPYADTYNVVVEGRKVSDEKTVAGLGWSYLSRERSNLSENEAEGNFAHGRLEFVQAKYTDIDENSYTFDSINEYNNARFHGTGQIYMWNDGRKNYSEEDRREAWGEALVPYGTELTVRVLPDEGYQLTSFSTSPNGFQATDEPGVYKIVLTKENFTFDENGFNLEPVFTEIGSSVVSTSENINSGSVQIAGGENAFANGTAKLEVEDVQSMSPNRLEGFLQAAENEEYEINNYLEIALYNSIYKGGKKDANNNFLSWDTEVTELNNNATVELELDELLNGSDVAIIHEIHDGDTVLGYDIIEAQYNTNNNTIIFETDSFSTYAIAYKGNAPAVTHTVTFNSNGGSPIEPSYVNDNETVGRPEDPENGDMIFGGWYQDETLNVEFDFNTPITSDLELFAKWNNPQSNTYRVSFNSNCEMDMGYIDVLEGQTVERPEDPENGDMVFAGWFTDQECTNEFDFNTPITNNIELFAKWNDQQVETKKYSANDEQGNSVTFEEEIGHTYTLSIVDYLSYSKEEVMQLAGITEEEYDEIFNGYKNAVKDKGTLISLLDIVVENELGDYVEDKPITIKLFLTETMKKYDTLKLIYVKDDLTTEEPITLTIQGNYATGVLQHLSAYTLVGTNTTPTTSNTTNNPQTGDNIYLWICLLIISIIGISITTFTFKKIKK